MPAIIYQKDPSELIPQGNRTVSTFPSGLVRVDQSFIGRTDLNASHRSQLIVGADFPGDQQPSYDGLRIFPEVQEKRLPNGFTEYLVSAYGRTTKIPKEELITEYFDTPATKRTTERLVLTRRYVISEGESYNIPITIDPSFISYYSENPIANISGTTKSGIFSSLSIDDPWMTFWFSFSGTGTVRFLRATDRSEIKTVTGSPDKITKTSVTDIDYGFSVAYEVTSGTISNIKVNRFSDIPAPVTENAYWLNEGQDFTNYGILTEVVLKYKSGIYY
jgi:hypothetical protein